MRRTGMTDWIKVQGLLMFLLLLLLVCCPTSGASASGQEVSMDSLDRGPVDLTDHIRILEDPEHSLTLQQVLGTELQPSFVPYSSSGLAGSLSHSAVWVRLTLYNPEAVQRDAVLELDKPHLGHISFYQLDEADRILTLIDTGRALPYKERLIGHRNFLFRLSLPPDTRRQVVMRIQTDSYLQLPLKLWETGDYLEKEQAAGVAMGLFYGMMLALAMFNGFLYVLVKERTYLYYVLFIVSFTLLQAIWDGLAYAYLWPGLPGWEAKSNPFIIVGTALWALLFTRSFLTVARYASGMDKVLRAGVSALAAALPAVLLLPPILSTRLAVMLASACLLLCMSSVVAVRFRCRSAYSYCASWCVLYGGCALNLMAAYKLLPITPVTLYAPRFGMAAGAVVLACALADRYNSMKRAKQLEEKQGLLLQGLHEITKTLTSTYDPDQLLAYTLQSLAKITACDSGCLMLKNGEAYTAKTAIGASREWNERTIREAERDPSVWLNIPIRHQERLLGVILLSGGSVGAMTDRERTILDGFAGQVGISIENARLFQEINRMATTDGLTGVCNRVHVLELAEARFRDSQAHHVPLSLVMADIDHFKKINDRYGHLAGDKVILDLVKHIQDFVCAVGAVGRYGGEEFIILLPGMDPDHACTLADAIRRHISRSAVPLDEGGEIRYTISLGVAAWEPATGSLVELIDQADTALYRAKEGGRNRVERFIEADSGNQAGGEP